MKKNSFAFSKIVTVVAGLFLINFVLITAVNASGGDAEGVKGLINSILDSIKTVAVPVAGAMVAVSGIMYIASGGSPEMINSAKRCLLFALIGAIVAFSAKPLFNKLWELF